MICFLEPFPVRYSSYITILQGGCISLAEIYNVINISVHLSRICYMTKKFSLSEDWLATLLAFVLIFLAAIGLLSENGLMIKF